MNLNAEEPAPIPNEARASWELVVEDMLERNRVGTEKYGTPLQVGNGRDSLVDAYQEALDLVVYLRTEIERRRREPEWQELHQQASNWYHAAKALRQHLFDAHGCAHRETEAIRGG